MAQKTMPSGRRSHFKTNQNFKVEYCPTHITQYESEKTGLRVVTVDQKGPKVLGYFAVATEIHDDSGAPHTLEHLVFMGSRSYKYKGFLDQLATRAYSDTNAWTDTDQTVYTLSSAGWDGFNQILPVYLEHVILPTLTDAGCYTEVHHVDGTGADAGVVYSEMQGRENTQWDLMELKMSRLMYPQNLGFRYETGGLTENLRVLTADRIRAFHRQMYQPKNLCIVLIGDIDHDALLSTLDDFEGSLSGQVPGLDEPFTRPWSEKGKAPSLKESVVEVIEFPEEDESMGEIMISYFGPDCNDNIADAAINVLLTYLNGSSIAVLDRILVEEEQLASSVMYETKIRADTLNQFTVSGVKTEKLETVEKRFLEVFEDTASKPFDMTYMLECLERTQRQIKFMTEASADTFSTSVIQDHLFGNRDGSTLRDLATLKEYDIVAKWTEEQWKQLFRRWFIDAHHVSLIGRPSKVMADRLQKDEEARVKQQRKKLGEDGLKRLGSKLDEAKAENDREIPKALLHKFETPGVQSIHFIPTETARSGLARRKETLDNTAQRQIDKDATTNSPLFIHFEHIPTNFVSISVLLCTHAIPPILRPLLLVYASNFFDTPITRNGQRIEYESVVADLERDTVSYAIDFDASNPELGRLSLQVEPHKYATAIEWIRTLLLDGIFDPTRLTSKLAQLLASIPEEKRSGDAMVSAVAALLNTTRNATRRCTNPLIKGPYLKKTLHNLRTDPASVIAKFEELRSILARPENFRCSVVADLTHPALVHPVTAWETLTKSLPDLPKLEDMQPLDDTHSTLSPAALTPGQNAHLIPLRTSDSSYLLLSTRGPTTYTDPSLPALAVAQSYLNAVEGPLWTATRGTGLAYSTYLSRSLNTGLLSLSISNSPDAFKAFIAAKASITSLATGEIELDDLALEGAISSIVVSVVNEQPTMLGAAAVGFTNQVIKNIDKEWGVGFMKRVRDVSKDEVRQAMREVIAPLLEARTANLVCVCAVGMEEGLVRGFGGEGFKMEVKGLGEFGDDYGLEGDGDGLDEDEDEDDDDDDEDEVEDEDEDEDDEMEDGEEDTPPI